MAYSNVILNGQEYYYVLYQMENFEWTLLFLVPSAYVATNTVQLVNTTTRLLLLITDEKSFIENAQAAFKKTEITLLLAKSETEANELLRKNPVDIVLLGSCLKDDTLAGNLHRLRNKTGNALLLYCCDYEEREYLSGIAENGGVDGVLTRPFFLSNLATVIDRVHSEVPADAPERASILNGMRFL